MDDFWKPRKSIELSYFRSINQYTKLLKAILKKRTFIKDILSDIEEIIDSPAWFKFSEESAFNMVKTVARKEATSWRQAAAKSSRGYEIYKALNTELSASQTFASTVQENAKLIRSVPPYVAEKINKFVSEETVKGKRPEALIEEIREKAPDLSENKARLIARTEVANTQATITQVRSQRLGLDYYVWQTSQDQRVRSSHRHMQGVICSYSNPPSPEAIIKVQSSLGRYGPGQCPNCRCVASPIIDPSLLPDRLKIVQGDKILSITKSKFLELYSAA